MEEKVLLQEARAQAAGEFAGADLEGQFKALEAGSNIDDELAALKVQTQMHYLDRAATRAKEVAVLRTR